MGAAAPTAKGAPRAWGALKPTDSPVYGSARGALRGAKPAPAQTDTRTGRYAPRLRRPQTTTANTEQRTQLTPHPSFTRRGAHQVTPRRPTHVDVRYFASCQPCCRTPHLTFAQLTSTHLLTRQIVAGGTSPKHQGPGVAVFTPNGVAKQGDKGSMSLKPGPPVETWRRGTSQEVAWGIRFNHGGGCEYRALPSMFHPVKIRR